TQEEQSADGRRRHTHRLQGRRIAAQVHFRSREDPRPACYRSVGPRTASHRQGDQERPRNGTSPLLIEQPVKATDMKVILTHEITNLGEPGDIVDVKDGYGRNYLLPRNYAMRWSKGAAKQVESIRAAREARAIHDREEAEAMKAKLEESPIDLSVRAGQGG